MQECEAVQWRRDSVERVKVRCKVYGVPNVLACIIENVIEISRIGMRREHNNPELSQSLYSTIICNKPVSS